MTPTAFVGSTLIDGTGAPPAADSAVVVQDGRIAWVGATSQVDQSQNGRTVDLSGKYLIPGLLDANVHLVMQCDPEVLLRYDPGCYDELVVEAAQVALRAGITTVFDTWGPLEALRRVRDRINTGEVSGARIYFAGNIIGNGGPWSSDFFPRYGDALNPSVVAGVNHHWEYGVGPELPALPISELRAAVRDYIATSGIDFVKFAASAHGGFRFIALSPDAQRAIVEEAHAAGMTAQACTATPEALNAAIGAGVDLLQHGDITGEHAMPRATLDEVVSRQLPCVAFLYTERCNAALRTTGEDDPAWALWARTRLVKDENDRRLIRAGARLLLANDMGVFGPTAATSPWWGPQVRLPDFARHLGSGHILWLQAAIERDMAPMEALLATTRNIAEAYGRGDELGTVEVGKRADLLVLDADPLDDPQNYARIAHVVKDGLFVERERLPERPVLTLGACPERRPPRSPSA